MTLETDIIQGRTEEKIGKAIVKNLTKELEELHIELLKIEEEIRTLSTEREWLDWFYLYKDTMKLTHGTNESKQAWIDNLVSKIIVHSEYGENRDQKIVQVGHSFDIHFKMKIVHDQLIWKHPTNKRKGYDLKDGKNIHKAKEEGLSYIRSKKKGLK